MNDEVSKALEWLRMLDATWEHAHAGALLAHLDGESARLAAAREEQREACARAVVATAGTQPGCEVATALAAIAATPIDSRPLADEMAQVRKERDALKELGEQRCDGIGCDRGECVRLVVERDEATSTMSRAWAAWARAADAALKGGGK